MPHSIKPLQRILVIRRDNIGDLICTLPLINNLRENYPQAQIDLLVNSYNQQTVEQQPEIDTVYAYTKAKHRSKEQSKLQVYWHRLLLLLRLRRKHYDISILAGSRFSNHALKLAKVINAKQIMSVVPASSTLDRIDLSIPESLDASLHEAEHCLALLPLLGIKADSNIAASLYANPTCIKLGQTHLAQQRLYQKSRLTIGIHISARKPSQRWSETDFIDLIKRLYQSYTCQFILFWAQGDENNPQHPGDDQKAQGILTAVSDLPVFPFKTKQLRDLIAGIDCCDQFICSDGGAMHIAAGLGKPLLCFFGDSNAQQWYPWQVEHQLLQPESKQVDDISPEMAFKAFVELNIE